MTTRANGKPGLPRFQFRVRTLLGIMTATCILLACLPRTLPTELRITLFAVVASMVAFAAWTIHRSRQRPWQLPDKTVSVAVDAKWLRRARSPLIMGPVATLTGVSVTFAPGYLLWCGQVEHFGVVEWILVPLCFVTIYFVPGFYMSLASEVIAQLLKVETPQNDSASVTIPENGLTSRCS